MFMVNASTISSHQGAVSDIIPQPRPGVTTADNNNTTAPPQWAQSWARQPGTRPSHLLQQGCDESESGLRTRCQTQTQVKGCDGVFSVYIPVIHSFIQASFSHCDLILVWTFKSLAGQWRAGTDRDCQCQSDVWCHHHQWPITCDVLLRYSNKCLMCVFFMNSLLYNLSGLHVCVICINMHYSSCCMFLHPDLASTACFLQRVHVEKWSGKRFPEPKKYRAQWSGWCGAASECCCVDAGCVGVDVMYR